LEQGVEFNAFLTGYTGSNDCDAVVKHMKKKFLAVYKDAQERLKETDKATNRTVYVYPTSALDLHATRGIICEGTSAQIVPCSISSLSLTTRLLFSSNIYTQPTLEDQHHGLILLSVIVDPVNRVLSSLGFLCTLEFVYFISLTLCETTV
jgi:hypothetical protein